MATKRPSRLLSGCGASLYSESDLGILRLIDVLYVPRSIRMLATSSRLRSAVSRGITVTFSTRQVLRVLHHDHWRQADSQRRYESRHLRHDWASAAQSGSGLPTRVLRAVAQASCQAPVRFRQRSASLQILLRCVPGMSTSGAALQGLSLSKQVEPSSLSPRYSRCRCPSSTSGLR